MTRSVLVLAVLSASCATPWIVARGAVDAADAALEALPDDLDGAEYRTAVATTAAALELGREACEIWQREATTLAPTGWAKWVADALRASASILDAVKASGVDVPPAISLALAALAALLPALGGS
jgi:hypothetical protein